MKLKYAAAALGLSLLLMLMPGMTAYAGSDIDFSLDINTDISVYITGESIFAPVSINTIGDNGYAAFTATLIYDTKAFALSSKLNDAGFKITENREGAKIEYTSPDGRVSTWGVYCIPLELIVRPAADGAYTINLRVDKCTGADGKELAFSNATPKMVNIYRTVVETKTDDGAKKAAAAPTTTTTAAPTTSATLYSSDDVYDASMYGTPYDYSPYDTPLDEYSAYYDPYSYNDEYEYPENSETSASGSAEAENVKSEPVKEEKEFSIGTAAAIMTGLAVMFGAGFGVGRITRDDGLD